MWDLGFGLDGTPDVDAPASCNDADPDLETRISNPALVCLSRVMDHC